VHVYEGSTGKDLLFHDLYLSKVFRVMKRETLCASELNCDAAAAKKLIEREIPAAQNDDFL
jgi:hypothetical protein